MSRIIPFRGSVQGNNMFLSEIGNQHLEYRFLSDIAGFTPDWSEKIRTFLLDEMMFYMKSNQTNQNEDQANYNNGLYLSYIDVATARWGGDLYSLQSFSSGFYLALIKSYIQSNRLDLDALKMYQNAIDSADRMNLIASIGDDGDGLLYVRDYYYQSKRFGEIMSIEGCSIGTMCALGAKELEQKAQKQKSKSGNFSIYNQQQWVQQQLIIDRHWELAVRITETCYRATNKTRTGLPVEKFTLSNLLLDNEKSDKSSININNNNNEPYAYFYLRPQLAETYFTLYRLTRQQKYREYAWKMAQRIDQYARSPESNGYAAILDVNADPPELDDYQPPIFLSGTLKYLYLTFVDDNDDNENEDKKETGNGNFTQDFLPLNKWIFNSAGHPLPICGLNVAYPREMCSKTYSSAKNYETTTRL